MPVECRRDRCPEYFKLPSSEIHAIFSERKKTKKKLGFINVPQTVSHSFPPPGRSRPIKTCLMFADCLTPFSLLLLFFFFNSNSRRYQG